MRKLSLRTGLAIGALAMAFAIPIASHALSIDSTRTISPREETTQQVNYYRFTVNYDDANIASGVEFGELRQNSFITGVQCDVTTAFNAGTTNVVTVGTTASNASIIAASGSNASISPGSKGFANLTASNGLGLEVTSAADVPLYAKYAQTGTAATAGSVTCTISFIPNNDM